MLLLPFVGPPHQTFNAVDRVPGQVLCIVRTSLATEKRDQNMLETWRLVRQAVRAANKAYQGAVLRPIVVVDVHGLLLVLGGGILIRNTVQQQQGRNGVIAEQLAAQPPAAPFVNASSPRRSNSFLPMACTSVYWGKRRCAPWPSLSSRMPRARAGRPWPARRRAWPTSTICGSCWQRWSSRITPGRPTALPAATGRCSTRPARRSWARSSPSTHPFS